MDSGIPDDWNEGEDVIDCIIRRHRNSYSGPEELRNWLTQHKERDMTVPKALEGKIGTKKAKQEHAALRQALKKDEDEVVGGALAAEKIRIEQGGINYALFNYILSATDFRNCEPGSMEAIRKMYEHLMLHLNRVSKEAAIMAHKLEQDFAHPTDLATAALAEITKRARERSKLNQYAKGKTKVKIYE